MPDEGELRLGKPASGMRSRTGKAKTSTRGKVFESMGRRTGAGVGKQDYGDSGCRDAGKKTLAMFFLN